MKISVIYFSMTGHSKKIAEKIANEFEIKALNIKENPEFQETDLLFIVGGAYGGQSLPEMIEYVKKISSDKVKNVALVTSCASMKSNQQGLKNILNENGINVIENEFVCQGSFMLFFGFGHPNKDDINNAIDYAKKEVEKLK
jgi:flavodoxin